MAPKKAVRHRRGSGPDSDPQDEAHVAGTFKTHVRDGTTIEVAQADILTFGADIIVNAAKPSLRGGGGLDGATHGAAGPEMLAELRREFPMGGAVGGAYPTEAYNIRTAKHVVHAIDPDHSRIPHGAHKDDPRRKNAEKLLKEAYTRSLRVAASLGARSIAFPTISTGIYGFPRYEAAVVATEAIRQFVDGEGAGKFDCISFLLWPAGSEDEKHYTMTFEEVFLPAESEPKLAPKPKRNKGKKRKEVQFDSEDGPEMEGLVKGELSDDRFTLRPHNDHPPLNFRHMGGLEEGESRHDRFTLGTENENAALVFDSDAEERKDKGKAKKKAKKERRKKKEKKRKKKAKKLRKQKREKKRKAKATSKLESEDPVGLLAPKPTRKRIAPEKDDSHSLPKKRKRNGEAIGGGEALTPPGSDGSGGSVGNPPVGSGWGFEGGSCNSPGGRVGYSGGGSGVGSGGSVGGSGGGSTSGSVASAGGGSGGGSEGTGSDSGSASETSLSASSTTTSSTSNNSDESVYSNHSTDDSTDTDPEIDPDISDETSGGSSISNDTSDFSSSESSTNSNVSRHFDDESNIPPPPPDKRQCRAWLPAAEQRRPVAAQCKKFCKMGTADRYCFTHRNWDDDSDNEVVDSDDDPEVFPSAAIELGSEVDEGMERQEEQLGSKETDTYRRGRVESGSPKDRFTLGPNNARRFHHMGGLIEGEHYRDRFTLGPKHKDYPLGLDHVGDLEDRKRMHPRFVRGKGGFNFEPWDSVSPLGLWNLKIAAPEVDGARSPPRKKRRKGRLQPLTPRTPSPTPPPGKKNSNPKPKKPSVDPNEKYDNWKVAHTCNYCGQHFRATKEYQEHMDTFENGEFQGEGIGFPRDPWQARLDKKQLCPYDQLPGPGTVMPDDAEKDKRNKLWRDTGRWHDLGNRPPLSPESGVASDVSPWDSSDSNNSASPWNFNDSDVSNHTDPVASDPETSDSSGSGSYVSWSSSEYGRPVSLKKFRVQCRAILPAGNRRQEPAQCNNWFNSDFTPGSDKFCYQHPDWDEDHDIVNSDDDGL